MKHHTVYSLYALMVFKTYSGWKKSASWRTIIVVHRYLLVFTVCINLFTEVSPITIPVFLHLFAVFHRNPTSHQLVIEHSY